jgi:hypothetical protein
MPGDLPHGDLSAFFFRLARRRVSTYVYEAQRVKQFFSSERRGPGTVSVRRAGGGVFSLGPQASPPARFFRRHEADVDYSDGSWHALSTPFFVAREVLGQNPEECFPLGPQASPPACFCFSPSWIKVSGAHYQHHHDKASVP